jgi:ribA/ribD-fused uncharacterized protein
MQGVWVLILPLGGYMEKIHEVVFNKVKDQYGWMSNMSAHPVKYEGEWYRNTETLFHCLRFWDYQEIVDELRAIASPMIVKRKAKKYQRTLEKTEGFRSCKLNDVDWMRLCLRLKVDRHTDLKRLLVVTRDATIIEDCTKRKGGSGKYWGACLEDGQWVGENVLGRLWMELREELKSEFDLAEKSKFFIAWNESQKPNFDLPGKIDLNQAA